MLIKTDEFWSRAILLVDLNAFFASIEQLDFPELRGRPVAVTNGDSGSCIITCSYEARHFGIKTGMRLIQAQKQCPGLIQCPARPLRYAEMSGKIMAAVCDAAPTVEIFSVDEAFLDVTDIQHLSGAPVVIAQKLKELIYDVSGLLCSVGVSGDKTTAKYAAKLNKPDGLTVILPEEARERLAKVPVTELCGIAGGIGRFLAERGVILCGDMQHLPQETLSKRFGALGKRVWLMTQGLDPSPVSSFVSAPKSIGHGKVVPPDTRDERTVRTYLRYMAEKVAKRLRHNGMQASKYFIGFKVAYGWLSEKAILAEATDNALVIYELCLQVLNEQWQGQGLFQVQVTALDPGAGPKQLDLFIEHDVKIAVQDKVQDLINQKFGSGTLVSASIMTKAEKPDVIAPAWRPTGARKSV